jgi:PKD domain-containing protein
VSLSATASDVWSAFSTGWDFGDGATGAGGSVTHAYAKAGDYTARVTSTDSVGNASSATLPVHVIQFLGSFGISRHTFAVGPQSTPVSAVKRGTTFRFALGAPATVKIQIARKTRGIRIGKRCRALTPRNRHRRHAKRCTLYVAVKPALTRHGRAGANSYPFSGRIRRKALKPGSYRATATAKGADGVVSRKLVVGFKIVAVTHKRRHG